MAAPGSDARRRRPPCCRWPCSRWRGPRASPPPAPAPPRRTRRDTLPDGTRVPTQAVRAPASLTAPRTARPRCRAATTRRRVDRLRERDPGRRARGVPARGDRDRRRRPAPATCRGSWSPRSAGSSPTTAVPAGTCSATEGIARPGIFGPALDGTHGTSLISDTDAGQYDGDTSSTAPSARCSSSRRRGRSSGSTPTTTASATRRTSTTPRSATAVYLCSGTDDLGTDAGQRVGGLPLQPQPALRRPGARDHAGLPGR